MKRTLGCLLAALLVTGCGDLKTESVQLPQTQAVLPLPSSLSREQYQPKLYEFLSTFKYRSLNWARDKKIRDTGPYKNGKYYGTHPAVKIWYSPDFLSWMVAGRQGEVPDGAMVIKEMFPAPAARYIADQNRLPTEWTVMIRDKKGAADGWYWSYYTTKVGNKMPPVAQAVDNDQYPFSYPNSGFGNYCVRCHASATEQLTFSDLNNVEGFPGKPIEYEVDDSWKPTTADGNLQNHPNELEPNQRQLLRQFVSAKAEPTFVDQEFLQLYPQFPLAAPGEVEHLKADVAARVVATKLGQTPADHQFMTSDQCMSCHSGDTTNFGPNLVAQGNDISPWGEWRWSMMGLAGRDPVFYAQLETETNLHGKSANLNAEQLQNLCLHCHGVMGQRQYVADHPGELFSLAKARAGDHYGDLALDGVSCTVCHQMEDPRSTPIEKLRTGDFSVTPRDKDGKLTVYGQFANPEVKPMDVALEMVPKHGEHMDDSKVCASCHTVYLPVLTTSGQHIDDRYEQSTYLEWQNSVYRDGGSQVRSCQSCHMPQTAESYKLANVQDQDFPETDHQADVEVKARAGYRRHVLVGANAFAMQFFKDFPDILGVNTDNFMTDMTNGIDHALAETAKQVGESSARLDLLAVERQGDVLTAKVKVTNLTGHRFPSGVGFRRAFLEFSVYSVGTGELLWSSGQTNSQGVLIDEQGKPLDSEFHVGGAYQEHHQLVSSRSEAQVYEELIQDSDHQFSTSFLSRVFEIKDNRLLPLGWTEHGPAGFDPAFAEATAPHGAAHSDPDFVDGTGSDTLTYQAAVPASAGPVRVQVRMFSQSQPPVYLQDRFQQASGPATKRLHFLESHTDTSKTAFPGRKLQVAKTEQQVP